MGHKRTSSDTLSNVRYWGQSGHYQAQSGHTEKLIINQVFLASEMVELRCFYGTFRAWIALGVAKQAISRNIRPHARRRSPCPRSLPDRA